MNNLIIALSGASHSGKTTFMETMKKKYPDNVILLNEEIRKYEIGDIDTIRKNPPEYIDLEIKINQAKADAEKAINTRHTNKVVLLDRSLVDCYFYYTFYVDKANLSLEYQKKYHDYLNQLYIDMTIHCNKIYDYIYFLEPITNHTRIDKYTQKNLKYTQQNEYDMIKILTCGSTNDRSKILQYNVLQDSNKMEQKIFDFIMELK